MTVDQALLYLQLSTQTLPEGVQRALAILDAELIGLRESERVAEEMVEKLLAKEKE